MDRALISMGVEVLERPLTQRLGVFTSRQLPFATSMALTNLAKSAQQHIRTRLLGAFTVRSRAKFLGGVKWQAARKSDWPHPYSVVGHAGAYMVYQEFGGTKRPRRGLYLTIPTRAVRPKGGKQVIPKRLTPRGLGSAARFADIPGLGGPQLRTDVPIRQSTPTNLGLGKLRIAYLLRPHVKVLPRAGLTDVVTRVCREEYESQMTLALNMALDNS